MICKLAALSYHLRRLYTRVKVNFQVMTKNMQKNNVYNINLS